MPPGQRSPFPKSIEHTKSQPGNLRSTRQSNVMRCTPGVASALSQPGANQIADRGKSYDKPGQTKFEKRTWMREMRWRSPPAFRVSGFGFRVPDFGIRISGFWFRDHAVCGRVSGLGIRDAGSRIRVSGFDFPVSGSGCQVLGFGFWISTGFGRVSGSEYRALGIGVLGGYAA